MCVKATPSPDWGGDEFTLLLPKIKRVENMDKIAGKVLTSIRKPLRLDGHDLHITTSIGRHIPQ